MRYPDRALARKKHINSKTNRFDTKSKIITACLVLAVLLSFSTAPVWALNLSDMSGSATGFFDYVFSMLGSIDSPPEINNAFLNKQKFVPGEYMLITEGTEDDRGVKEVKVGIEFENSV